MAAPPVWVCTLQLAVRSSQCRCGEHPGLKLSTHRVPILLNDLTGFSIIFSALFDQSPFSHLYFFFTNWSNRNIIKRKTMKLYLEWRSQTSGTKLQSHKFVWNCWLLLCRKWYNTQTFLSLGEVWWRWPSCLELPMRWNMHPDVCAMCETAPPFWCQRGKPRQGGGGLANWKQTWGEVMYGCVRLQKAPQPPNSHWRPRLMRPLLSHTAMYFRNKSHERTEERQQRCSYWRPNTGGHREIQWVTLMLLKKESRNFFLNVRQTSVRPTDSPTIWWADSGCCVED